MSKHRVAVLKVVSKQRTVSAAAAEVGLSRQHLQRLLRRYREGGLDALEPRSRRPHASPGRLPDAVRERIVAVRTELTARGLDAGPLTIAWHLKRESVAAPSTSTVRRVLHAAGHQFQSEESGGACDAWGKRRRARTPRRRRWYSERVGDVLIDLSRFGRLDVP
ncbi:MAG: helix-turn-helix domain-containing protein [Chloroflexota bacterium]